MTLALTLVASYDPGWLRVAEFVSIDDVEVAGTSLSCATSRYGTIADVKEVLSREDLKGAVIDPWKVDVTGAKKFIAHLFLRDQALGEPGAPYVDWELSNPPFAAKIAALLVSGGAPTPQDALVGAVDTWRHRGLGFNLGVLRSKLLPSVPGKK